MLIVVLVGKINPYCKSLVSKPLKIINVVSREDDENIKNGELLESFRGVYN